MLVNPVWLRVASAARREIAGLGRHIGIPQFSNLVLRREVRDSEGNASVEIANIDGLYIDFVTPQEGRAWSYSDCPLRQDDYHVRGIDRQKYPAESILGTGFGYWIGGRAMGDRVEGGFACDLLNHSQDALTIDLYLRKRVDDNPYEFR